MSRSTIAIRANRGYLDRAYAAPIATLFSRQKPCVTAGLFGFFTGPSVPMWCPGGRTTQNTFRTFELATEAW